MILSWGHMGITQKFMPDITNGGSPIDFFLHKFLTGEWSSRESKETVEILTIIMLIPTRWIGLGYGFGV